MLVHTTPLKKAAVIEMEPIQDSRGFFARSFCKKTLAEHGVSFEGVQSNVAFNHQAGTLRGMHFQVPPFCEQKIISCHQGAIYDVIIDLNRDSPTFGKWFGLTLSAENHLSLYVPKGFAHGYQTLTENASIHYMVSEYYAPTHESGVRWNDPAFEIEWPHVEDLIISQKDKQWRDFDFNTDGMILSEGEGHG
ncbi:dTDP-4-dehydrorhamnose 3,5-epimerase [Paenibacillus sp. LC231]|uniref:dTDP-4-dehydrorhamnose 3,5-epimerase n=1 Tax=unclassified Paenibacillus TaxID=185978 RepID=UPI0008DCC649|nr:MULTISPECIES: dTDP-4-dehydrorhamnose 3,5-epimerase [unclassified Paenibacillus]MCT1399974.1 dTDP-4-dehydrorhamnose 3,5-epimerase [Paenibacillus sp. p3-SID867]OIB03719.1 dTDP-4-dehydrorhamnose 3,5-epimerase [Paenibacillus sp. LC231]